MSDARKGGVLFGFPFFLKPSELLNDVISKQNDDPEECFAKCLNVSGLNCESQGYKSKLWTHALATEQVAVSIESKS